MVERARTGHAHENCNTLRKIALMLLRNAIGGMRVGMMEDWKRRPFFKVILDFFSGSGSGFDLGGQNLIHWVPV